MADAHPHIVAKDLTMAYGDFLIQQNLNFEIQRGEVFIIMGGSGCGKSTLLKIMIGLKSPKSVTSTMTASLLGKLPTGTAQMKRKFGTCSSPARCGVP